MKNIFSKIKFIFTDPVLRRRILFLLGMIFVFRLLATVPIPGVDEAQLRARMDGNGFLGMLNMFSGGGMRKASIVMLGVMPYITASIIMQVAQMAFPKLKEMQREEGEAGRRKIGNISRIMSVFIAGVSAYGYMALLQSQGILPELQGLELFRNMIVIIAGSVFLMWIGELISEFGIGNGLSILIFAGIIAALPGFFQSSFETIMKDPNAVPMILGISAFALALIYFIVYVSEAERPVPIQQTRVVRAGEKARTIKTFLPIKLNQAGVIPIIFGISILMFPQMIMGFLTTIGVNVQGGVLESIVAFTSDPIWRPVLYFILVFLFTFFYTSVTFDPEKMAEDLQKAGNFVPGIRPGEETEEFFAKVTARTTFIGAVFLGFIAVLPIIITSLTNLPFLGIGGTSILIVVSVAIDLLNKIDAQISVREYLKSLD